MLKFTGGLQVRARREQGHLHVCGELRSFVSEQRTAAKSEPHCPHQANDPDSNPRHLVTLRTERQEYTEKVHFVMTTGCDCDVTGSTARTVYTARIREYHQTRSGYLTCSLMLSFHVRLYLLLQLCRSFSHQNYVQILRLPQTIYIPSPSKSPRFHYRNNWPSVRVTSFPLCSASNWLLTASSLGSQSSLVTFL